MRPSLWLILIVQAALVVLLAIGLRAEWLPLGVRGEWEWNRLPAWVYYPRDWLVLVGLAPLAYAGFVAMGLGSLGRKGSMRSEAAWLSGLFVAAIAIQVMLPLGAASGYDLSRWASVNYLPSSTGYFQVAREQANRDPWRFLADYPEWIRSQDSMHIGTHPPGLIVVQCTLMKVMERNPALADFLLDHMPRAVEAGFRAFAGNDPQPLTRADRAALYATALLTLLACAGTVVPLYFLARVALTAPAAWAAASLWPLAPAANLFQPVADTGYPLLSTTALALAAWALRFQRGSSRPTPAGILLSLASGAVMAVGMVFTLAFLPVGLIVGLVVVSDRSLRLPMRAALILATGVGFLTVVLGGWVVTRADPLIIWSWNLHHHARFYLERPRSYRLWLWVNPIELMIAAGLPTVVWCVVGLSSPRNVPSPVWCTILVLVLVNLTGRNMGEVARLWMLFLPPLFVAAGVSVTRLRAGPVVLGTSAALVGFQTLALQAMIQVVYPV